MFRQVLVAGGAGFVGGNFVLWSRKNRPETAIVVLDKLTRVTSKSNLGGVDGEITYVQGDIRDASLVDKLVADCDAVVNFATETRVDNPGIGVSDFLGTNVEGTCVLIEACCRRDVRYHHISTNEIYGSLGLDDDDRFTENSPIRPSTPFGYAKAASNLLVEAWCRESDLQATISIRPNNYGPRQNIDKFIPRQITSVLSGARPTLYGDGRNVRDWIHVDDHSSAVWAILERGRIGETYLVGADCEKSNLDVIRAVLTLMGKGDDDYDRVPDRANNDGRYAIDSTKLKQELGWRPEHDDFLEGLKETIAWYQANEGFWAHGMKRAETTAEHNRNERRS